MEQKKPRVLLKNQKHIDFCIEYITSNFNQTQSYMKVMGCSYTSAATGASRLLKRQDIKDFIVLICYKSGGPGLLSNKRETAKYIGEFVSCGEDTDSAVFVKMITSAGGGDSRQRIYKSIFQ